MYTFYPWPLSVSDDDDINYIYMCKSVKIKKKYVKIHAKI